MHKLTIHPSEILKEENTLFNTVTLIATTLALYLAGSALQQQGHLALFWPMNAVLVGIFIRNPFLNRTCNYLICLLALLLWSVCFATLTTGTVLSLFSNFGFVALLTHLILREKRNGAEYLKINVLRLFVYCLLCAAIFSAPGAYGFSLDSAQPFWMLYPIWLSESFSTSVLILPFALTCTGAILPKQFGLRQMMPLGLLLLSMSLSAISGGIGCLSMILPALVWCALSYSLSATCLLTMLTGTAEVLMVDAHWAHNGLAGHLTQIFSARMGIASIAVSPVIVAVSVLAINNLVKQLSARANYDYLTQVYSRFGLYEQLKAHAKKPNTTPLNVLLLDIDHFKHINDTHGHDCGDIVLAEFARRVTQIVGEQGLVARMGGEEFAVVMPDACGGNGYRLAEEIRAEIEHMQVEWHGDTLSLTVSIGLSHGQAARRQLVDVFDRLLSEADRYLYQSKKSGRNRTCASPSVMDKQSVPSAS